MSKYFAIASFFISLVALGVSIICCIDAKDDIECSVSYQSETAYES